MVSSEIMLQHLRMYLQQACAARMLQRMLLQWEKLRSGCASCCSPHPLNLCADITAAHVLATQSVDASIQLAAAAAAVHVVLTQTAL